MTSESLLTSLGFYILVPKWKELLLTVIHDPDLVPFTTVITVIGLGHPYLNRVFSPLHCSGDGVRWLWGHQKVFQEKATVFFFLQIVSNSLLSN